MKNIIFITIVFLYSISIYAEVYTFVLRNDFYLQIRTLENTTLQDLVINPYNYFALFLLTPSANSETITDWGFVLYGIGGNDEPSLIDSMP